MSFENIDDGVHFFSTVSSSTHPDLRTIHIGQTVFMAPKTALLILRNIPLLEKLTLVDVYPASIWGKRLRIGDIKRAFTKDEDGSRRGYFENMTSEKTPDWDETKARIVCKVQKERIMGGDRG